MKIPTPGSGLTGREKGRRPRGVHGEEAQGVVEFAVLVSVLVVIFLGLVDFSRFLYYDNAIRNAARTGAEAAMEHCSSSGNCAQNYTPMTDDVVLQATVCESKKYVQLQPTISASQCASPCDPGNCSGTPCPGTSQCCSQDVCIDPGPTRSLNSDVTVYVGYAFQPWSFPMKPFFPTISCWSADGGDPSSSGHTLCASSTGRVK